MKKMKTKRLSYWLKIAVIGIAVGFAIQYVRAWVEPPSTPGEGDIGAPINTSAIDQTKGNATSGKINAADFCLNGDLTKCLSTASFGTTTTITPTCASCKAGSWDFQCFDPNTGAQLAQCPCFTQWIPDYNCCYESAHSVYTCIDGHWVEDVQPCVPYDPWYCCSDPNYCI